MEKDGGKDMKQVYNPYLPSYEYIPDGEPHVFGDRVYLYGSHDRFDGAEFCLNDYVCYSANVKDLTNWKYEGVIYRKEQDPRNWNVSEKEPIWEARNGIRPEYKEQLNPAGIHAMWAPDVVEFHGKYYLYYCLDYLPEIGVAVAESPVGPFEFLGFVKYADGTILGRKETDLIQFDPGIFVDDDGTVYLYSGNAAICIEDIPKSERKASQVMKLSHDMMTLIDEPKLLMPDLRNAKGTGFENHEFFEASSIRKINSKYYFVYSSVQSHELCYAISNKPDGEYLFGGTLVDIGDIFLDGRTETEAINCLGNTHGGIECIDGQWYVFYHRQTNRSNYSRQACAEKIYMDENGKFSQAEVTSCGLNKNALVGKGVYPAYIACHLTRNGKNVFSGRDTMKMDYPFFTQDEKDMFPDSVDLEQDRMPVQYIKNILDGTRIGYKYFHMLIGNKISLKLRGEAQGTLSISAVLKLNKKEVYCKEIPFSIKSVDWIEIEDIVDFPQGELALYFSYIGTGSFDFKSFEIL